MDGNDDAVLYFHSVITDFFIIFSSNKLMSKKEMIFQNGALILIFLVLQFFSI